MQHPASRDKCILSVRVGPESPAGSLPGFFCVLKKEYNTFGGNSARIPRASSTQLYSRRVQQFAMLRVAEMLNADNRSVLRIRGLTRWYHFLLSDEFQLDLPLFGPSDDPSRTFQSLWTCECPS